MNRIIIIIFAALAIGSSLTSLTAQKQKRAGFDREAFFEKRKEFITKELGLTKKEIANFIPLYDEFQRKKYEAGSLCRTYNREKKDDKEKTDNDYLRIVDECIESKVKEAMIEKEYFALFKKKLSPKKVYKLSRAESKFVREFMKEGERRK